jgi:hypothetical protein
MADVNEIRAILKEQPHAFPNNIIFADIVRPGLAKIDAVLLQFGGVDPKTLDVAGAPDIFKRIKDLVKTGADTVAKLSMPNIAHDLKIVTSQHYSGSVEAIVEELSSLTRALQINQQQGALFPDWLRQCDGRTADAKGACGIVFRVANTRNESYALKVILKAVVGDSECAVLKKLTHPNIVRYFAEYPRSDINPACFLFEWVGGGTLWDKVQAGYPFTGEETVGVVRQITSALCYMHGKRVLHRDLKLDNVMLTDHPNGCKVKIIDLGFACAFRGVQYYARGFAGFPGNASYEKCRLLPYDGRDDVYAVGRICLALVLGTQ